MEVLALIIAVYFLPSIIAAARYSSRMGAVFLLNLLAGWSVLGWVLALAWALTSSTSTLQPNQYYKAPPIRGDGQRVISNGILIMLALMLIALASALAWRHFHLGPLVMWQDQAGKTNIPSVTPASDEAPKIGAWVEERETSKLTGHDSVVYTLGANTLVEDAIGLPGHPTLQILCLNNETRLIWDFHHYHGSDPVRVSWRLDNGPLRTQAMDVSANGQVFGYWNGQGIAMLKQLASGNEMVIAAAPWERSPVEVTFALKGISEVVRRVRAACGW
jgi:type VI secretion system VasI family protein